VYSKEPKKRTPCSASSRDQARVRLEITHILPDRMRSDVAGLENEARTKLTLDRQVIGFDIASTELAGQQRVRGYGIRDIDNPGRQVWKFRRRNTGRERTRRNE